MTTEEPDTRPVKQPKPAKEPEQQMQPTTETDNAKLFEQIESINPSAQGPLYRRIMIEDDLNYLRENEGIIGFELDLDVEQELSGFLLVAIKKHTVLAFVSDVGATPRLILFPSLNSLFDATFEMLDLCVEKKLFMDKDFSGTKMEGGVLRELVKDLTPPEKDIDIPDSVSDRMVQQMQDVQDNAQPFTDNEEAPKQDETPAEAPAPGTETPEQEDAPESFDEPDDFNDFDDDLDDEPDDLNDEPEDFNDAPEAFDETPKEQEDERATELQEQTFERLADVGDYVHVKFGVPKTVTTQVVNKALQSDIVANKEIDSKVLAVKLFSKLFNEKKV